MAGLLIFQICRFFWVQDLIWFLRSHPFYVKLTLSTLLINGSCAAWIGSGDARVAGVALVTLWIRKLGGFAQHEAVIHGVKLGACLAGASKYAQRQFDNIASSNSPTGFTQSPSRNKPNIFKCSQDFFKKP